MLTPIQEELVRLLVQRLREGGLEYEARVREFVSEEPEMRYMHVDDLDRRFGAIERRFDAIERALKDLNGHMRVAEGRTGVSDGRNKVLSVES